MTNVQAAVRIVEHNVECEARLRPHGREFEPRYAEAVALAIMALNNYEY